MPFAIPVVVVLRLIKPWLLVRYGGLRGRRLGHFAANTEQYICERDAGFHPITRRHLDIYFLGSSVSNKQLATMWSRVFRVWPNWIRAPIHLANMLIPGGAIHIVFDVVSDRDVHNLLDRFPAHLKFTAEEEARGEAGLRKLGVPAGAPFVCLTARDSTYLDARWPQGVWDYQSYRDSDIQNYVVAAEELADRGYFVIRMGSTVRDAMKSSHPNIIDYATNGMRTDFMDIYLSGKCDFCVSTGCGVDCVSLIFRRPLALVNFVPIVKMQTYYSQKLCIAKRYYSVQKDREMTFKEIFTDGTDLRADTFAFESAGIALKENTPEEIRDLVVEMAERQKGTWQDQEVDEGLQRKFWELFPADSKATNGELLHGEIHSRFGAGFLRNNQELLQ